MDWNPIWLSFKLAGITTLLLFILAVPLANFLVTRKARWLVLIETLVSMPLVLPPTVIGFYFLLFFSPNSQLGQWLSSTFDIQLVFTFEGLIMASLIYSLPFMVHPLMAGFGGIATNICEAAQLQGLSKTQILWKLKAPIAKKSILSAVVLTFAHTLGEFGMVLMLGGNIPGETKVASIAIFDEVERLQYDQANQYALTLFCIAFVLLLGMNLVNRRGKLDLFRLRR